MYVVNKIMFIFNHVYIQSNILKSVIKVQKMKKKKLYESISPAALDCPKYHRLVDSISAVWGPVSKVWGFGCVER